jgi:hypothetical protein
VTRYVIDPPTLLHLVANDVRVSPRHRIVAPNLIRAQALSLLLQPDALVTVDPALARRAEDVVPLAPLDALTADPD